MQAVRVSSLLLTTTNYTTLLVFALSFIVFMILTKQLGNKNKMRKIPGPVGLPFLGNTLTLLKSNDLLGYFNEMTQKYGKKFKLRVGNTHWVFTTDLGDLQTMLSNQDGASIHKPDDYDITKEVTGERNVFLFKDKEWYPRRKMLNSGYKLMKFIPNIPFVETECKNQYDNLDSHADNKDIVDISRIVGRIMLKVGLGFAIGFENTSYITKDLLENYLEDNERSYELVDLRFKNAWFRLDFLWRLFGYENKMQQSSLWLKHAANKGVTEPQGFFPNHLKSTNLPYDEKMNETIVAMVGAYDTTRISTSFTIFLLGLHPEIQEKVHQELDSVFHGEDDEVTFEKVNELQYLTACIKEALRLFPPSPIIMRKLTSDLNLDGEVIPKNSTIVPFIYGFHHSPTYFPDPEKFDPERFIRNPQQPAWIPFFAGSRNCIGQKIGLLDVRIVTSCLLRKYRFEATCSLQDLNVRLKVFLHADKFPVRVFKRQ